jgi:hypothetical protein
MKLIEIAKHNLEEPYLRAWVKDEEIERAKVWSYELGAMVELDLNCKETYERVYEQIQVFELR